MVMSKANGLHLVIARYRENLDWLVDTLRRHQEWRAFVYNDGDRISVPDDVREQLMIIEGDKSPSEPSKYLRHIIDFWGCFDENTQVAFLQADPLYHNPTIQGVLDNHDKWNRRYQTLTLIAHPPPWGVAQQILEGSIQNITVFADNARVWHDILDDNFQGLLYYDAWMTDFIKSRNANVTVSHICDLFKIAPPAVKKKAYAALFGTTWKNIYRLGKQRFKNIHHFLMEGDYMTRYTMNRWDRGCIMEYMWSVIFESEPLPE